MLLGHCYSSSLKRNATYRSLAAAAFLALTTNVRWFRCGGVVSGFQTVLPPVSLSGRPHYYLSPSSPPLLSVISNNNPVLYPISQRSGFVPQTSKLAMSSSASSSSEIVHVDANLKEVQDSIVQACEAAGRDPSTVRLVAVSKTKPLELLQQAYEAGQRVFGENYAQELVEKAQAWNDDNHPDVTWHFIGGLQSNKCNLLVKNVVPHGHKLVVETVSTLKLAKKLDNAMAQVMQENTGDDKKTLSPLEIFVQLNTSGEDSKSGVATTEEMVELCQQILAECDPNHIQLKGVMTIGAPGDVNCLDALVSCRNQVAQALDRSEDSLEVSMGMSGDYVEAIAKGSTNVRVGSTIFGARDYSNKA